MVETGLADTQARSPMTDSERRTDPSADQTLGATNGSAEVSSAAPARFTRGSLIDRYVVLQELGAGGMGVVYAAYDPELDRKVALKLLLPGVAGVDDSQGRTRLLREAQALARLSHPNVVAVHDVGTHGDQVWLAMEFVQGTTLGGWLAHDHSWREVMVVMEAAGRGLAAAHAAGLLHRDFKPDNVMVGSDGRVRVMDFGLARAWQVDAAADLGALETAARPELAVLAATVTRAGTVMGTPAYMSAEQFRGAAVTAAADQFSFCVSLWEALYGERPFRGSNIIELAANILLSKPRPPPNRRGIPAWLRRVCERGLNVEPGQRWSSMEALLHALARGQAQIRTRRWLAAVGAVALLAAGVAGYRRYDLALRTDSCTAEGDRIAAVWNDEERRGVRDAILATSASYAPTTAEKVMPWLDQHAEAWKNQRTLACMNASVHGSFDADTLDRAQWCLDDLRLGFAALIAEFRRADPKVVQKAVAAASGLRSPAPCLNRNVLQLQPVPSLAARETITAVRAELATAFSLLQSGRYDDGLAIAEKARAAAETLDYTPLVAMAFQREGKLLQQKGDAAKAEAKLERAYFLAVRDGQWDVAGTAATELIYTVGYQLARNAEGRKWSQHAEVLIPHSGDLEGLREANRLNHLAVLLYGTGEYAEALAANQKALAIRERAVGPNHPVVAGSLSNLANVRYATGAFAEGLELYQRVLNIREQAFGLDHPLIGQSLQGLASMYAASGNYAEAERLLQRSLALTEAQLGPDHVDVAMALNNLAFVERNRGAFSTARPRYERALAIFERVGGADHPDVAMCLDNLAIVATNTARYAEARALLERALAIREKNPGPEHRDTATSLANLADVHQILGEHALARALHERALAIREKVLGPSHDSVAHSLSGLASIDHSEGDDSKARALYTRALAIREAALGGDHPAVAIPLVGLAEAELALKSDEDAMTHIERAIGILAAHEGLQEGESYAYFVLAKTIAGTNGDPAAAIRAATTARDGYRQTAGAESDQLTEVQRWLDDHRRATPQ